MTGKAGRISADREGARLHRRRRGGLYPDSGEQGPEIEQDSLLKRAGPEAGAQGAALGVADGGTRERVVSRLQREQGNLHVQQVVDQVQVQRATEAAAGQKPAAPAGTAPPQPARRVVITPEVEAEMKQDIEGIVPLLKSQVMPAADEYKALMPVKKWFLRDVQRRAQTNEESTDYLDHFLFLLKMRTFPRRTVRTGWVEEWSNAYDLMWREMEDDRLSLWKAFVAHSRKQGTGGPTMQQMESIWGYVGKRELIGLWGILKGMGTTLTGLLDMAIWVQWKTSGAPLAAILGQHGVKCPPALTPFISKKFDETAKIIADGVGVDLNEKLFGGMTTYSFATVGGKVVGTLTTAGATGGQGAFGAVGSTRAVIAQGVGQAAAIAGAAKGVEDLALEIQRLREKGWTVSQSSSSPDIWARIVGVVGGAIGAKGSMAKPGSEAANLFKQLNIGVNVASAPVLIAAYRALDDDKTLSDKERQERKEELLANLISAGFLTVDMRYGEKFNKAWARRNAEATGQAASVPKEGEVAAAVPEAAQPEAPAAKEAAPSAAPEAGRQPPEKIGPAAGIPEHPGAFLERGVFMTTSGETYIVRAGPPGSYGDHLFGSLAEAQAYARHLASGGEAAIREASALPRVWPGGAQGNPVDAINIFRVPSGTSYIQGVVGPQLEGGAVYGAPKTYAGGGPQVVIDRKVRLGEPVASVRVGEPAVPGAGGPQAAGPSPGAEIAPSAQVQGPIAERVLPPQTGAAAENTLAGAREILVKAGNIKQVRKMASTEGELGENFQPLLNMARKSLQQEAIAPVLEKYPDLVAVDKGTPGLGSDTDITFAPKDPGTLTDAKAVAAAVERSGAAAQEFNATLRKLLGGREPDVALDTNAYTWTGAEAKLAIPPEQAAAAAHQMDVASLTEIRRAVESHGGAPEWTAFKQRALEQVSPGRKQPGEVGGQQAEIESHVRRDLERQFAEAESLYDRTHAAELKAREGLKAAEPEISRASLKAQAREQVAAEARAELVKELRNSPIDFVKVSRLQAEIKLMEPGAFATAAAVADVVGYQQTLRGAESYQPKAVQPVTEPQLLAQSAASNFAQMTKHLSGSVMEQLKAVAKYAGRIDHARQATGKESQSPEIEQHFARERLAKGIGEREAEAIRKGESPPEEGWEPVKADEQGALREMVKAWAVREGKMNEPFEEQAKAYIQSRVEQARDAVIQARVESMVAREEAGGGE